MVIYFGADHGGFALKEKLISVVKESGHEVVDCGNAVYDKDDDYPDFASAVARKVKMDPAGGRGIVICKSGAGADIVANKFIRVRSVLGLSPDQVYAARHDDDANVLAIASDFTSEETAEKMVTVFLETPFGGEERYRRRLDKIAKIENAQ